MASDLKPFEYADKYAFLAEWFNDVAEVVKPFLLSFYPHDNSLELYDVQYKRIFLRRAKVQGITLSSLYKGAYINIFSRQIKVVDYANVWTENVYQQALQKIFAIVKPDAISKLGEVIGFLEKNEFKLANMKMGRMTKTAVTAFFAKTAHDGLLPHDVVNFMTEGPSLGLEAIGPSGHSRWSEAVGPEDPLRARQDAPASLRACLGTDPIRNAIHTAPDLDEQQRESELWFSNNLPILIEPTVRLVDSTCCVIKPHAVQEAIVGDILTFIANNGFHILALEMLHLNRYQAEEFYEVYKGVVPEFSSMVTQLSSGACIALEVANVNEPACSAELLRQLTGPNDPVIAKEMHPNSIRAKFGTSTVLNAVHCTDLPEDAKLELEFFFKLCFKKN